MRTKLFWAIMQRVVVITYWCFRTTDQSHFQGSNIQGSWPLQMGPTGCPDTSVRNYYHSLHNRSSHLLRGGTLKSHKVKHVLNGYFPQNWGLWRWFTLYSASSDIQLIWSLKLEEKNVWEIKKSKSKRNILDTIRLKRLHINTAVSYSWGNPQLKMLYKWHNSQWVWNCAYFEVQKFHM